MPLLHHTIPQHSNPKTSAAILTCLCIGQVLLSLSVCLCLPEGDLVQEGKRWWSHIKYLADDKLEGRNTGSEGYHKAAAYVAEQFKQAGLNPAGTSGYFQPIKFRSRQIVEARSSLTLLRDGKEEPVRLGDEALFSLRSESAEHVEAPVVFIGYGLSVPEKNYDDLAGLDLRGKIVMFMSGGPATIPGPVRAHYQTPLERAKALHRAGALGMATVQNPHSMDLPWTRQSLARLQPAMSIDDEKLNEATGLKLFLMINPEKADKLLAGSGHMFSELVALADAEKRLPRFPLKIGLRATMQFEKSEVQSENIIGILPGHDPMLKSEYVVLSAHLDHLGVGQPIAGDSIYNGAMDNASGVASLIEIAHSCKEFKGGFRRSLLFLALTGEEKGLLGSKYFAAYPTVQRNKIVADINMDTILPLFPLRILTVQGLEESDLGERVRKVAESLGVTAQVDQEPNRNRFIRSDQYSFIRVGIPALAFKFGFEKGSPQEQTYREWWKQRYHAPSDDAQQPVDFAAAGKFNQLILALVERVANQTERPRWYKGSFFRRFAQGKSAGT